jgi:hypothetical protein
VGSGECDNCATPDNELVPVRRVYLRPETWDSPASEQVMADVERWCVSCWSQYPNVVVDETN